jgi:hypothetical protein
MFGMGGNVKSVSIQANGSGPGEEVMVARQYLLAEEAVFLEANAASERMRYCDLFFL